MATGSELASAWVTIYPKFSKDFNASVGDAVGGIGDTIGRKIGNSLHATLSRVLSRLIYDALNTISDNIGNAVERADILNNFPIQMKNFGYSADDAEQSIERLHDAVMGLPTALDTIASATARLAPMRNSLSDATDLSIALNNAIVAGGQSAVLQKNAMEQFSQMLAVNKVDVVAWRSVINAMPAQMQQLTDSIMGTGHSVWDLYHAMQAEDGQQAAVTFEDFIEHLLKLNEEGINGLPSLAEQAKKATFGIGTAMNNVTNRLADAGARIIDGIGRDRIATEINNISKQFGGWADKAVVFIKQVDAPVVRLAGSMKKLGSSVKGVIAQSGIISTGAIVKALTATADVLDNRISPFVSGFGGRLTSTVANIKDALSANKRALLDWFDAIGSAFSAADGSFTGIANSIIGLARNMAGDVLPLLTQATSIIPTMAGSVAKVAAAAQGLYSRVAPRLREVVSKLIPQANDGIELLTNRVDTIADVVGTVAEVALDVIDRVTPLAMRLAQAVLPRVDSAVKSVVDTARDIYSVIVPHVQRLAEALIPMLERALDAVRVVLDFLLEKARSLAPAFGDGLDAFTNRLGAIEAIVSRIWSLAGRIANVILPVLDKLFDTTLGAVLGSAVQPVDTILDKMIAIADLMVGKIESHEGQISQFIRDVGDGLGVLVTRISTIARELMPTVKQNAIDIWRAFTGMADLPTVGTVFEKIGDVIEFAMRNAVDLFTAITNGIKNISPKDIDTMRGAIARIASTLKQLWADNKPVILDTVKNIIPQLVKLLASITQGISEVLSAAGPNISALIQTELPKLVDFIGRLATEILPKVVDKVEAIMRWLTPDRVEMITKLVVGFLGFKKAADVIAGLKRELEPLSSLLQNIGTHASNLKDKIAGLFGKGKGDVTKLDKLTDKLGALGDDIENIKSSRVLTSNDLGLPIDDITASLDKLDNKSRDTLNNLTERLTNIRAAQRKNKTLGNMSEDWFGNVFGVDSRVLEKYLKEEEAKTQAAIRGLFEKCSETARNAAQNAKAEIADAAADTVVDTLKDKAENVAETVAENVSDVVTEGVVDGVGDAAGHAIAEGTGDAIAKNVAESVSESIAETVAENVAEAVTEGVVDGVGDAAGHAIAEGVGKAVAERAGDAIAEGVGETAAEKASEAIAGGVAETAAEKAGNAIAEGVGKAVAENAGEAISDGIEDAASNIDPSDIQQANERFKRVLAEEAQGFPAIDENTSRRVAQSHERLKKVFAEEAQELKGAGKVVEDSAKKLGASTKGIENAGKAVKSIDTSSVKKAFDIASESATKSATKASTAAKTIKEVAGNYANVGKSVADVSTKTGKLSGIFSTIGNVFSKGSSKAVTAAKSMGTAVSSVGTVAETAASTAGTALAGIVPKIATAVEGSGITGLPSTIATAVGSIPTTIATGMPSIMSSIGQIATGIVSIFTGPVGIGALIVGGLVAAFTAFTPQGQQIFDEFINHIKTTFDENIKQPFDAFVENLKIAYNENLKPHLEYFANEFAPVVQRLFGFVSVVFDRIAKKAKELFGFLGSEDGKGTLGAIFNLVGAILETVAYLMTIAMTIFSVISRTKEAMDAFGANVQTLIWNLTHITDPSAQREYIQLKDIDKKFGQDIVDLWQPYANRGDNASAFEKALVDLGVSMGGVKEELETQQPIVFRGNDESRNRLLDQLNKDVTINIDGKKVADATTPAFGAAGGTLLTQFDRGI